MFNFDHLNRVEVQLIEIYNVTKHIIVESRKRSNKFTLQAGLLTSSLLTITNIGSKVIGIRLGSYSYINM